MLKYIWLIALCTATVFDRATADSDDAQDTIADSGAEKAKRFVDNYYEKMRLDKNITRKDTIVDENQTLPNKTIIKVNWILPGVEIKGKVVPDYTYDDIIKNPSDTCVQCVMTGGKWTSEDNTNPPPLSSFECHYKKGSIQGANLSLTSPAVMSPTLTYGDMFDGLAICDSNHAPTHFGTYDKKNQFGVKKSTKTCENSYNGDDFSDGTPSTDVLSGYNFTFSWNEKAKKGDWCYIS